ncbi:chromosome segregation ATPase [Marinobacter sp. GN3S48]|uniref:chromosome segregation ATPase n=1 Tax=Marinobacter sp. GN3S48 TaxID=3382302 RepID=UPI00387AEFA5
MPVDQIESLFYFAIRYGFEAAIAGVVVFLLIKFFLPGYLTEKGKNLATQEDIEGITEKVESVKTDYAKILEEVKSNNQIKIAAIEREKTLKKEVYMDAVEAITIIQNMLSSLSNLTISNDQLTSTFSSNAGKIARVQLVGGKETVNAVTKFIGEVAANFLDLILERAELLQRQGQIQGLQIIRNEHQAEVERYIQVMKSLNLEGVVNQGTWEYVDQSFKFESQQRDRLDGEIVELSVLQNQEHLEFTKKTMGAFYDVSEELPDAVLSVRNELDLEIEEEDYRAIFQENIEKGRAIFEAFIQRIESQQSLSE